MRVSAPLGAGLRGTVPTLEARMREREARLIIRELEIQLKEARGEGANGGAWIRRRAAFRKPR